MAKEPEGGKTVSGIARAGKRKWGYDPTQVDAFLERAHTLYESDDAQLTQQDIQNASFDLCRGGYAIGQVDAALARLERAVVDKQTTWEISRHGRVAWKAQTEDLYRSIARHAERVARERFRDGDPKTPSYDRKQVDRLIDQVVDKAAAELGLDGMGEAEARKLADVNSTMVSNAVFTQRRGRRGYDERQVDYYLNACARLLSRIESYARVADYVNGDGDAAPEPATTAEPVDDAPTMVAPLFGMGQTTSPVTTTRPAEPAGGADDFDTLHQAEQAIFTAPPAPTVMPAPVSPSPRPTDTQSIAPSPVPAPPVATPAAESRPPAAPATTQTGDTALAALAQMAESVQTTAETVESGTFAPHVPDLKTPSVPSLGTFDIPDLSFPTLKDDSTPSGKDEQ